jgi:hypothetical protein
MRTPARARRPAPPSARRPARAAARRAAERRRAARPHPQPQLGAPPKASAARSLTNTPDAKRTRCPPPLLSPCDRSPLFPSSYPSAAFRPRPGRAPARRPPLPGPPPAPCTDLSPTDLSHARPRRAPRAAAARAGPTPLLGGTASTAQGCASAAWPRACARARECPPGAGRGRTRASRARGPAMQLTSVAGAREGGRGGGKGAYPRAAGALAAWQGGGRQQRAAAAR